MSEEDACLAVLVVDPARGVALREVECVGGHGDDGGNPASGVPHCGVQGDQISLKLSRVTNRWSY